MELSLDSALSLGAAVGHMSYFLLVLSMLQRRIGPLRILAILSAVVGITYDAVWLKDPVGIFWESLLLLVNVGQLGYMHLENRRATFSTEEEAFIRSALEGLTRRQQRQLLDAGLWLTGETGDVLTREGQYVGRLVYLATGEARISLGGVDVAACRAGAFIGEMTVLSQEPATGTAILSQPSRYWAADARVLRQLVDSDPELRRTLTGSFARNVRDKLVELNRSTAEARSGPTAPGSGEPRPGTSGSASEGS